VSDPENDAGQADRATPVPSAFDRWESALPAGPDELKVAAAPDAAVLERVREQAYAAGLATGRQIAESEQMRFADLAKSLQTLFDTLDFQLAEAVRDLALDVAQQVLASELAQHPEHVLESVKLALQQLGEATREVRLVLNPEDAELVRNRIGAFFDASRLRVVEDLRMVRGGCRIETAQGDIDATLPGRWRQVALTLGSHQGWLDE
jgi:flagellar assembly protein FliH